MSEHLRLLAYCWAAPNSLVGLALGLPALALGARPRLRSGTIELCGGRLGRWWRRTPVLGRFSAVTFGHVILATGVDTMASCRDHERVHVRQYERWGPAFLPAYLLSSLWQIVRGRPAYLANVFERQAYESNFGPQPSRERNPSWR